VDLPEGATGFIPKGSQDSARGFKPWFIGKNGAALKGRQKGITEF
jgi:hypothetical protein